MVLAHETPRLTHAQSDLFENAIVFEARELRERGALEGSVFNVVFVQVFWAVAALFKACELPVRRARRSWRTSRWTKKSLAVAAFGFGTYSMSLPAFV